MVNAKASLPAGGLRDTAEIACQSARRSRHFGVAWSILPRMAPGLKWIDQRASEGWSDPMASLASSTASRIRPLVLLALLGGAILAGTMGLWAYYGTAVFFEIVRTGWIACF
jgi:hypothetical protein